MIRFSRLLPLLMVALILPACGMPKQAAEKALNAAELAYAKIAEQARNVAPDQAQPIEAGIAAAKGSLAKGDFNTVTAAAKDLSEKIETLSQALPDLQTKLQDQWKDLSTSVPAAIAGLQKKLDDFGRPPAGMPGRAKFDAATAALAPLGQQWEQAKALFASGKLADAVAKGDKVKNDAVALVADMQSGS